MTLSTEATTYLAAVIGVALVVFARWSAKRPGTRWESLGALRTGDVLLTECVGAFLIGYALGSVIAPSADLGGPPGRRGPPGRFGGGLNVPFTFGIVLALLAAVVRIDFRDLLLRGPTARNPLQTYVGWDAIVSEPIPAGGYGAIRLRDGLGNVTAVAATSETALAEGAHVRITRVVGLNLVVEPF
jgi:membrane protein implicated in regulation of membrane protease activity